MEEPNLANLRLTSTVEHTPDVRSIDGLLNLLSTIFKLYYLI